MVVAILFLDYSTSEGYIDKTLYENAPVSGTMKLSLPPPHMHTDL